LHRYYRQHNGLTKKVNTENSIKKQIKVILAIRTKSEVKQAQIAYFETDAKYLSI